MGDDPTPCFHCSVNSNCRLITFVDRRGDIPCPKEAIICAELLNQSRCRESDKIPPGQNPPGQNPTGKIPPNKIPRTKSPWGFGRPGILLSSRTKPLSDNIFSAETPIW